ncbi:MAG: glycoside hydrolase family 16 protein [Bacteroidales bacterium]|nr:glycoside hydrolase family 16 protein [Bacteroidales bacterium]
MRRIKFLTSLAGSIVGFSAIASCAILSTSGALSSDRQEGSANIEITDSSAEMEAGVTKASQQIPKTKNAVYTTVFFDDFNNLDEQVWTLHSTSGPASGGRYNARFRTDRSNVYVDRGHLVLDCSKTADKSDGTYKKSNGEEAPVEYIAPYISTCDNFAMSEGRISARIKVSKGIEEGVFPFCFWTFGQNNAWPYAHEMDILEASASASLEDRVARNGTLIPSGSRSSVLATHLHVRTSKVADLFKESILKLNWALYEKGSHRKSIDFIKSIDPTKWHVYAAEWDKKKITYYVDGRPVASYDADELGAISADGEIGFFYPQDIRFNIKAGEHTTDRHGYMYIDWVKAESPDDAPCRSISHDDTHLKVGGSLYINPTFNDGCANKAFDIEIENDGVLVYQKYLNDASQMVVHRIIGRKPGVTTVTLRAANDKAVNSFKVTVE